MRIQIKRLPHAASLPLPVYARPDDAGLDLRAAIERPLVIPAGERRTVPTGFAVALRPGFVLLICPRSGLAQKDGITVLNAPGVIDPGYTGEIGVILHNSSGKFFVVEPGARIAQGVLCPVYRAEWEEVTELAETARGEAGFGSTGAVLWRGL